MLDACDRHGVLVMDEAFDMWHQPKSEEDYSRRFAEWWNADIEAMVRNAQNHPSVVMYCIGNEIPDGSTAVGLETARALAAKVRSLDDSRYVTQAITGILVGGPELLADLRAGMAGEPAEGEEMGVNTAAMTLGEIMRSVVKSPLVDVKTVEAFAYLDVAGYNYMDSRYDIDAELHPGRVIVGTESHPAVVAGSWPMVEKLPSVIGDFVWTGWDYLGEAGIGRSDHSESSDPQPFHGDFPWRAAWCGDLDLIGDRRPQSYHREIVFGLRTDPYIAVLRPEHQRRPNIHHSPWSWNDVVSSWSWPGHDDELQRIEVYSGADEVELLLDGRTLGRQPSGEPNRYTSVFEVPYSPGELEAVAWTDGVAVGRSSLRSATTALLLRATADRQRVDADPGHLVYVEVSLVDEHGVLHVDSDRNVEVDVAGPAVLQGLGSANPRTAESFTSAGCSTFGGRALAIVRPTGEGEVTVSVTAEGCDPAQVAIDAAARRTTG